MRKILGKFLAKIKASFLTPSPPKAKRICKAYIEYAKVNAKGWAGRIGYAVLTDLERNSHLYRREIDLIKIFIRTDDPSCAHPSIVILEKENKLFIPSPEFSILMHRMIGFVQNEISNTKLAQTTNYNPIISDLCRVYHSNFLLLFCVDTEHNDYPNVIRISQRIAKTTTNYLVNAHIYVVSKNSNERQNKTAIRKLRRAEDLHKIKTTKEKN